MQFTSNLYQDTAQQNALLKLLGLTSLPANTSWQQLLGSKWASLGGPSNFDPSNLNSGGGAGLAFLNQKLAGSTTPPTSATTSASPTTPTSSTPDLTAIAKFLQSQLGTQATTGAWSVVGKPQGWTPTTLDDYLLISQKANVPIPTTIYTPPTPTATAANVQGSAIANGGAGQGTQVFYNGQPYTVASNWSSGSTPMYALNGADGKQITVSSPTLYSSVTPDQAKTQAATDSKYANLSTSNQYVKGQTAYYSQPVNGVMQYGVENNFDGYTPYGGTMLSPQDYAKALDKQVSDFNTNVKSKLYSDSNGNPIQDSNGGYSYGAQKLDGTYDTTKKGNPWTSNSTLGMSPSLASNYQNQLSTILTTPAAQNNAPKAIATPDPAPVDHINMTQIAPGMWVPNGSPAANNTVGTATTTAGQQASGLSGTAQNLAATSTPGTAATGTLQQLAASNAALNQPASSLAVNPTSSNLATTAGTAANSNGSMGATAAAPYITNQAAASTPTINNTSTSNTMTTAYAPSVALQPGSTDSTNITALQKYLVQNGFMSQSDMDTGPGIYGPKTTAAVQAMQQKFGVNNSSGPGYYGPQTMAALNNPNGGGYTGQYVNGVATPSTSNNSNALPSLTESSLPNSSSSSNTLTLPTSGTLPGLAAGLSSTAGTTTPNILPTTSGSTSATTLPSTPITNPITATPLSNTANNGSTLNLPQATSTGGLTSNAISSTPSNNTTLNMGTVDIGNGGSMPGLTNNNTLSPNNGSTLNVPQATGSGGLSGNQNPSAIPISTSTPTTTPTNTMGTGTNTNTSTTNTPPATNNTNPYNMGSIDMNTGTSTSPTGNTSTSTNNQNNGIPTNYPTTSTTNNGQDNSYSGLIQRLLQQTQETPAELALRQQQTNVQNALNTGVANEQNNPIPLEFQTGRVGVLRNLASQQQETLAQQVANMQQQRQISADAYKTAVGASAPIQVSPGTSVVSPTSGNEIYSGAGGYTGYQNLQQANSYAQQSQAAQQSGANIDNINTTLSNFLTGHPELNSGTSSVGNQLLNNVFKLTGTESPDQLALQAQIQGLQSAVQQYLGSRGYTPTNSSLMNNLVNGGITVSQLQGLAQGMKADINAYVNSLNSTAGNYTNSGSSLPLGQTQTIQPTASSVAGTAAGNANNAIQNAAGNVINNAVGGLQEGQTQQQGGVTFKVVNGKWVAL